MAARAANAVPFLADYLPAMLGQASALISSEFHAEVRARGFTVAEWRVLACLATGLQISIGDLAEATLSKQPTLTRQLDRMEASGYIGRTQHPVDGRVTLVHISAKGKRIAKRLVELSHAHEKRVLEPFGMDRADDLKRMLRQLIDFHQSRNASHPDEA